MIFMLCRHRVADFVRWHKVFESHAEAQREAGLHVLYLLHDTIDYNHITYLFRVDDVDKAKAFTQAPVASEAVQESGIIGPFEMLYLTD